MAAQDRCSQVSDAADGSRSDYSSEGKKTKSCKNTDSNVEGNMLAEGVHDHVYKAHCVVC